MSQRTARPKTLADIAARCGLSRMAVSYALRGNRTYVSQATIDRVTAAAREIGYDPGQAHAARRLRYQGSGIRVVNHVAALFFPVGGVEQRYWALILQGLHDGLAAQGFGMLICDCEPRGRSLDEQLPVLFRRGDVDGAVVFATEQYRAELIEGLRRLPGFGERPVVTLTEAFPGCTAVVVDDLAVGRLAAGHLLDLGHRHLATFKAARYNSPITLARIEGQRQAFGERGLAPDAGLHVLPWLWDAGVDLAAAAAAALDAQPEITGILAPNDGMGIPLVRALARSGRRVPRDLSVIGADDCGEWPETAETNRWTTIRIPLRDLGRQAARALVQRIRGERVPPQLVVSAELVVRGSTAPPRGVRVPGR